MKWTKLALPESLPDDVRLAFDALQTELAKNIKEVDRFNISARNAAPGRPMNGDIFYADGTNWNPGAGEGFYGYENGAYAKL